MVVDPEGAVQVDLDLGSVRLRDGDLVPVAGHVGGHRTGGTAAHCLDRGGLRLRGVGAGAAFALRPPARIPPVMAAAASSPAAVTCRGAMHAVTPLRNDQ